MKTPPRMWGRRGLSGDFADLLRNTPTHVGKTEKDELKPVTWEKHPHACGEDY